MVKGPEAGQTVHRNTRINYDVITSLAITIAG